VDVSTWMGDRWQTGKTFQYVTSHPGQLSLAITLWVGTMGPQPSSRLCHRHSIDPTWEINRWPGGM